MLTDLQLAQILRNASQRKRELFLGPLNAAMARYQIDGVLRTAAFIAQLAHESGEFRFMEEIWGPTDAQRRYEPPTALAQKLGNTQAGDGKRFKGRGPIQVTGRYNYQKYGDLLGIDLVGRPELAATPEVGFETAGLYWEKNRLNALADAGDFKGITRRINGGQNGAADRERFYRRALEVLADAFPAQAAQTATPARTRLRAAFERGAEHIDAAAAPTEPTRRGTGKARPAAAKADAAPALPDRVFNARPDTLDFRDRMYMPTLIEVPTHIPLGDYLEHGVPVLDQGTEGACTGFGLATVANYLLLRRRVLPDAAPVSPRMLYELARRYDEWPGEDYAGSSARGAMKGWHKHGVCTEKKHPYKARKSDPSGLTEARTLDALQRPLGAYFRVNHKDLVAMHSAIAEVGILYTTCTVHQGWMEVGPDGVITPSDDIKGGHAFAIAAYDDEGFWLQNSWGPGWGRGGFARVSYDDWLRNGTDAWVARLGAPVQLRRAESAASAHAPTAAQSMAYAFADLRPHIVSVGNNGELKAGGDYGSTHAELAQIFEHDIPRVMTGWARPRVLLYAHGGLVSEQAAVQRLAEYRPRLLDGEVYPLAFIWRTDYWTTLTNILQDAVRRRRTEGALDAAKDFMLDRFDDALEPLARTFSGKTVWDEIKQNALAASAGQGAAVRVADHLQALAAKTPGLEIHLVGHSAGAVLCAPLVKLLADRGLKIHTCTLWAPACTVALFDQYYQPALEKKQIGKMAAFVLNDEAEQDDHCARIYNKSMLYLVSHALEEHIRIPFTADHRGTPLLGMTRWHDDALRAKLHKLGVDLVVAPNTEPAGSLNASNAQHHGDFDDDERTVLATFGRIAAVSPAGAARASTARSGKRAGTAEREGRSATSEPVRMFSRSGSSLRDQRQQIDLKTR